MTDASDKKLTSNSKLAYQLKWGYTLLYNIINIILYIHYYSLYKASYNIKYIIIKFFM